jgi:hypothetical protein
VNPLGLGDVQSGKEVGTARQIERDIPVPPRLSGRAGGKEIRMLEISLSEGHGLDL